jgi:hypothetical protein
MENFLGKRKREEENEDNSYDIELTYHNPLLFPPKIITDNNEFTSDTPLPLPESITDYSANLKNNEMTYNDASPFPGNLKEDQIRLLIRKLSPERIRDSEKITQVQASSSDERSEGIREKKKKIDQIKSTRQLKIRRIYLRLAGYTSTYSPIQHNPQKYFKILVNLKRKSHLNVFSWPVLLKQLYQECTQSTSLLRKNGKSKKRNVRSEIEQEKDFEFFLQKNPNYDSLLMKLEDLREKMIDRNGRKQKNK